MYFHDIRNELLNNPKLQEFEISDYTNAGGHQKNDLLQIYLERWMPCRFEGIPLELHFEIQSDKVLRLDCHWYVYNDHKNYKSKADLITAFPHLDGFIEERQNFIRVLSAEAQTAYPVQSRIRQVKFNALSGIEWIWKNGEDWQDIASEIAEIVVAVSPYVNAHFEKEINN